MKHIKLFKRVLYSIILITGFVACSINEEVFEDSKLSYSYSHISNNDWGDTNPGTDNQHITFSKSF